MYEPDGLSNALEFNWNHGAAHTPFLDFDVRVPPLVMTVLGCFISSDSSHHEIPVNHRLAHQRTPPSLPVSRSHVKSRTIVAFHVLQSWTPCLENLRKQQVCSSGRVSFENCMREQNCKLRIDFPTA